MEGLKGRKADSGGAAYILEYYDMEYMCSAEQRDTDDAGTLAKHIYIYNKRFFCMG